MATLKRVFGAGLTFFHFFFLLENLASLFHDHGVSLLAQEENRSSRVCRFHHRTQDPLIQTQTWSC